jgi:hypothetical protein
VNPRFVTKESALIRVPCQKGNPRASAFRDQRIRVDPRSVSKGKSACIRVS